MAVDDTIHRSTKKNREAMYAFFQKFLGNPGDPADIDVKVPEPEELRVTTTGQLVIDFGKQSVFSLNNDIVEKQKNALDERRVNSAVFLKEIPAAAVKQSGFNYPEKFEKSIFSGRYIKTDFLLEKYLVPGSGDYILPTILFRPLNKSKEEIILVVHTEGMDYAVNKDSLAYALVKEGYTVVLTDLPGIGSMGPGFMKGDSYIDSVSYNQWFAAVLTGGSNVGLRVEDILRIVHFALRELQGFSSVSALAIGSLGSELIHAAAFEPDIKKICLIRSFLSYGDIASTRFYKPDFIPFIVAGAINDYDLPDLMAALCPRKVLLIDPLSGDGLIADKAKVNNILNFPSTVYSEEGSSQNLEMINTMDHELLLKKLLSWLP
jgi:hypothetical protein